MADILDKITRYKLEEIAARQGGDASSRHRRAGAQRAARAPLRRRHEAKHAAGLPR